MIESNITYNEFKNAVSIYIAGVSSRNFWSSDKDKPGKYILLGHLDNHIQNNQLDIYLSSLTSNTPEYVIHETPKNISIFFKEDTGLFSNTPVLNNYKCGNVLLEFSYENGVIDYQLAFNKKLNKL
jgi:hypothetical protein